MKDESPLKVILVRSRAIDPNVNKVAKALAEGGYKVDLLVWSREGERNNSSSNNFRIHRFGLKASYYRPSLLLFLPIWWLYEFLFLLRNKVSTIHACDLDTLIPAAIINVIRRKKLCYTIYDFYADILPRWVPGLIRQWVSSAEKFLIRFTDVLFLPDQSRYEQVRGARIKQIIYIYNSPEDYLMGAKPASANIGIFYGGYLDKSRGLEAMIKAIRGLNGVSLTIAGTGPYLDVIKQSLAELPNLSYLGQIPHEEVIVHSLDADILFAFYDPEIPSNRYASPNKLFEAMMCAKPIIVNEGIRASQTVADENCGLVVPYGDVEAIKQAIVKLKDDVNLRQNLGKNGRKAYEARYSWDIMKKRLIAAYRELAKAV